MINKSIIEINQALKEKKITINELLKQYNNNLKKVIDAQTNAVSISLIEESENQANKLSSCEPNSLLFGIPCSIKNNICTKGIITSGGSKTLKHYIPPFNATVVDLLLKKGAIINSKANLDEFGMGGYGVNSSFGVVKNLNNNEHIVGGSSSGSIVLVKEKACSFAIATDTGDSIRRPCSINGLVGFKPTYGLISRFGVLPYSPSLDHVGVIANHIEDIAVVLNEITGFDNKDHSSLDVHADYLDELTNHKKTIKLGVLSSLKDLWTNKPAYEKFNKIINLLKSIHNIHIIEFDIEKELLELIEPLYQVISYSEALSSWNNLSGITFGYNGEFQYSNPNELMFKLRSNLGKESKKRFIFGSIATNFENFNDVYLKSKEVIKIFKNKFNKIFESVDACIIPGSSDIAPKINDILENKYKTNIVDDLLQIANFIHAPSITIPAFNLNNFPIGINIFSKPLNDKIVLNIAHYINSILKENKYE